MNIKFPCDNVDDDLDCLWGILSISIKVMGGIDPEPGATKSLSGITAKASKTQKEVPDLNWSRRDSSFTKKIQDAQQGCTQGILKYVSTTEISQNY